MRNTKYIVGVCVVLAIVIAGAYYTSAKKSNQYASETQGANTVPTTQANYANQGTLAAPLPAAESSTVPSQTSSVKNNVFYANIDGYYKTCSENFSLYTNNGTKKVFRRDGGVFSYLNGELTGYCDVEQCSKIENPYQIDLVEHVRVGEKEITQGRMQGMKVAAYESKPVTGTVTVKATYYTDAKCTQEKQFSTTLENK